MRSIAIRLGGVLILAQSLGAQPSPRARIIGRTHARGDSTRAVPDAEVALFPGARTTRSDSIGAFEFAAVADGEYRLRVRRLGFEASELPGLSELPARVETGHPAGFASVGRNGHDRE